MTIPSKCARAGCGLPEDSKPHKTGLCPFESCGFHHAYEPGAAAEKPPECNRCGATMLKNHRPACDGGTGAWRISKREPPPAPGGRLDRETFGSRLIAYAVLSSHEPAVSNAHFNALLAHFDARESDLAAAREALEDIAQHANHFCADIARKALARVEGEKP